MKEKPMLNWQKENNKSYYITGVMQDEGGGRSNAKCLVFNNKNDLRNFNPLSMITKKWEDWFIEEFDVNICDIYKDPYNFPRTGCKGCPFSPRLQHELDVLEKYFPAERKQCELIWKPVYEEYRKISYRLNKK